MKSKLAYFMVMFLAVTVGATPKSGSNDVISGALSSEINIEEQILTTIRKKHGDISNIFIRAFPRKKLEYFLQDIRLIPKNVEYSKVQPSAIPDTIFRATYLQKNCTEDEQSLQETLQVSYVEGATVNVTKAVTTSGNFQISVPVVNLQIGISRQVNVSSSKTENFQKTETETQSISVKAPPKNARLFTLEKRVSNGYLAFKGIIVVDGKVGVRFVNGDPLGVAKLSDALTEAERTFTVEGEVWNVTARDKVFTFTDSPLDPINPLHCPRIELSNSTAAVTNVPLNSILLVTNVPLLFASRAVTGRAAGPPPPVQTTTSLSDGMSVTTADVIANVEVRAKSLGPGLCATTISSNTNSVGILAPPLIWSSWFVIDPHIGVVTKRYNTSVVCDTGALFELRYWK